jgi:hypothetical protein
MDLDTLLNRHRLPQFSRVDTFADLPPMYVPYYYEPPLPHSTPTHGIVVSDLRSLVGLPISRIPLSIVNCNFPHDEIALLCFVLDWLRANCNFATLCTFSETKVNQMIELPPAHLNLTCRRQALRRVFLAFRGQALTEYNPT